MDESKAEALRVAPVVGVNAGSYLGFPLSDWVYILTIIYLVLQITSLVVRAVTRRKT